MKEVITKAVEDALVEAKCSGTQLACMYEVDVKLTKPIEVIKSVK